MRKQYTVHYNESGEIACEGTFYSKSEAFDALQEFITDINAGVDEKNEDYLTPFDFHLESIDEREPEDYIKDFKDAQEYIGLSYNESMNTEYNKLSPLRLSLSYEQVCEEYRLRLCNQFGIDWHDTYWIAGRVGGVLDIQSYYAIDMDELRYIVDNSMTFEDFEEWYDQLIHTDNKKQNQHPVLADGCATETFQRQMKYIVKEQKECSHRIFSVVNSESGARINYFQDRSEAEEFAAHQNSFVR